MKSEYARSPWEDTNATDWTFLILLVVAAICGIAVIATNMIDHHMSNDEIIAEVKKCNDAGLVGQVIFDKQKRYVIGVQCITTIKEAIEQPTGWEA